MRWAAWSSSTKELKEVTCYCLYIHKFIHTMFRFIYCSWPEFCYTDNIVINIEISVFNYSKQH